MFKADIAMLIINAVFCGLVWIEFFTGGYERGLNYYNMGIARGWAFMAAVSMLYFLFTLAGRKPRPLSIGLLVYSCITIAAVIIIVLKQI